MRSRRKLLNDARLYLILDREVNSYEELFDIAQKALKAGVDIIQLRDKVGSDHEILQFAQRLSKLTQNRIPFIVNDRVDLALASQATGVHLGQDDMPLARARKTMGPKALIGISCQTLAHAQKAMDDGADYIGFGSVFKTLTKPNRVPMDLKVLETIGAHIILPVFAIGGIQLNNVTQLKRLGVHRIAVCRAVCQARNVEQAVYEFKTILETILCGRSSMAEPQLPKLVT